MLHVWLVPVLVLLGLIVAGFYLAIHCAGGNGERTDGRCVCDSDTDDQEPDQPVCQYTYVSKRR